MTTVSNDNLGFRSAALCALLLYRLDNINALHDVAKHHVLPVEPVGRSCADEELGPVGVGPGVSHGQSPHASVLQLEVLVRKFLSVDGFASSSIVVGKVPALAHEFRDDAVKRGALVAETFLSGAQSTEIFCKIKTVCPQKAEKKKCVSFTSGRCITIY